MIGPDGRDVLDVPASGVTAMNALGWTELADKPGDPSTTADTDPTQAPKQRTKKTSSARRRVPKPGDDD